MQPLTGILSSILVSSQNAATLEAAHALMSVIAQESHRPGSSSTAAVNGTGGSSSNGNASGGGGGGVNGSMGNMGNLDLILSKAGLAGIWKAASFEIAPEQQRRCGVLIDKLIEVCFMGVLSFASTTTTTT